MAGKLLGNLRVRLTAETEDFRRGLANARRNLNTFEKDIQRFRRNTLTNVLALGTLTAALGSAISVANRYERANSQLAATAKLTGTELEFLQSVSASAQAQFKLNTVAANGLTIELTKLATKAGDVGQASAGLAAFLDIGAARGLDASQTLQAVQQAILGIDEGTDKLFGKNPSEIYKEFAASIGTTVGRLTDQQKAQALLNAAMQDGAKVRGEYARWLKSSQGQQFLLAQSIEQTQAALGEALKPALVAIIPVVTTLVEWVQKAIQGVQMLGASLAFIPALWNAGILALQGNFQAGRQEIQHQVTAWREMIEEIKSASSTPAYVPPVLPTGGQTNGEANEAGRATARSYFDGLKEEWENLRYTVALRSISLTGSDAQRRALEEEHQLRLLSIEAERLSAMRRAGELTAAEWLQSVKLLDARRELVKARRRELDAVDKQLAKQRNLMDLTESVAALLPKTPSGPGADIGSKAAKVLDDELMLSEKLAGAVGGGIGSLLGGLAGNFLIPGVGAMLGGLVGDLFGGDDKEKERQAQTPIVRQLEAIERVQKETISAIKGQTDALLNPESRLLNLPSSFRVPTYRPMSGGGGGSTTSVTYGDTHLSVHFEVTSSHSPDDIRRIAMEGIEDALHSGRRAHSWSTSLI
ncbi:MAG TPA: hypothetical protein VF212_11430 [Longimicrobiales bacterium]